MDFPQDYLDSPLAVSLQTSPSSREHELCAVYRPRIATCPSSPLPCLVRDIDNRRVRLAVVGLLCLDSHNSKDAAMYHRNYSIAMTVSFVLVGEGLLQCVSPCHLLPSNFHIGN